MTKIQGNQGNKNVKSSNNAFLVELNLLIRKNDPNLREPREQTLKSENNAFLVELNLLILKNDSNTRGKNVKKLK